MSYISEKFRNLNTIYVEQIKLARIIIANNSLYYGWKINFIANGSTFLVSNKIKYFVILNVEDSNKNTV